MPSSFRNRTGRREFLRTSAALLGGATSGRAAIATTSAVPGRFIVDATTVAERKVRSTDLEVVYDLSQIDRFVVRGAESTVSRLTDAYVKDERIQRRGEPGPTPRGQYSISADRTSPPSSDRSVSRLVSTTSQSDVPYYRAQWDKHAQNIETAHEVTRGEGVRVAIVDSGVQADHPDLQNAVNLPLSRPFTNDGYGVGRAVGGAIPWHGTSCAGVIAANGTYLLGSAPGAEIVDCRVFEAAAGGQPTGAFTADYLAALVHAADVGCDVANVSLGPGVATPIQLALYQHLSTSRIVNYANEQGMLVVVAAGNDAIDLSRFPQRSFAPQTGLMVISATGPLGFGWPTTDDNGDGTVDIPSELSDPADLRAPYYEPALYTNYGAGVVSVSAPGGNYDSVAAIQEPFGWFLDKLPLDVVDVSYDPQTGYVTESDVGWTVGTSFAAPQVAGAAALVRSANPSVTPEEVQATLERTATDVGRASPDPFHGAGFLNPNAALRDE